MVVRSDLGPENHVTATGDVVVIRVDPSDVAGHQQWNGGALPDR